MKTLKRRYPSKLASVSKARREVSSFANSCGLFQTDISDITLAAGEACNNAAEHGHKNGGCFTVACSYDGGEFTVSVADEGCGFDPAGKGECIDPEHLGIRGLGIFIMRSLMDDVCFSQKDGGTRVQMVKFGLSTNGSNGAPADGNGQPRAILGLGAMHYRLKSLLELARVQMGSRRQR
ncbi:MAG: ATP-binding protein [Candidatus Eremiobacteraeota bacterium]|nr:ATP-binding protein [Candidatus Eremiobacteraeota bacterium]